MPSLLSRRSTCLTACFVFRPPSLRQGLADQRYRQRGGRHRAERRSRQCVDPLGMQVRAVEFANERSNICKPVAFLSNPRHAQAPASHPGQSNYRHTPNRAYGSVNRNEGIREEATTSGHVRTPRVTGCTSRLNLPDQARASQASGGSDRAIRPVPEQIWRQAVERPRINR